ncbi:EpsG family protein, partial [Acinetobacter soli]
MKKYNVINFAIAMINPVFGFFSTLKDIMQGRDASLIFAFCVSLICVYFPLMYDTSSNFYVAYLAAEYSNGFNDWLRPYVTIPSILMNKYHIDFYFFIFFNVIFVVYTWTKIIVKTYEHSEKNYFNAFVFMILLLLTFNYRDLMDLNRNIFSYSFIFYYIFLIKNKSLVKAIFFCSLAVWIHNSSLIVVALYLVSLKALNYRLNFIILILSLILGVFIPSLIGAFEKAISSIPFIGQSVSYYIYGSDFGVQEFTTGTLLKKLLNCSFVFLTSLLAIFLLKKNPEDRILQFIILLGAVELFFLSFVTFFERLNLAFNFIYIYILFRKIPNNFKILISGMVFFRSAAVYILLYFPIFFGSYT